MLALGTPGPLHAGKGSSGVVKATAMATKIDAAGKQTVTITLAVDKGWHIYANPVNNKDFVSVQTVVTVNARTKPARLKIQYPQGKEHEDKGGPAMSFTKTRSTSRPW